MEASIRDILSSPLSSPPPSGSLSKSASKSTPGSCYRPARELPFELAQHAHTYYEEGLFAQAFGFLTSITSGSASPTNPEQPIIIPPPSHLSLAATIAVHPTFTSRTLSREKREQSISALRYLHLVGSLTGPVHSNALTAFSFTKYAVSARNVHFSDGSDDESNPAPSADLNTIYASEQSLWTRTEDFWHLLGWALNCGALVGSPLHATRWNSYVLLLDFLFSTMESDWRLRAEQLAEESLLWSYVELGSGGHARARRMLRAIFADGSTRALNEFRPIFAHELKEPKSEGDKARTREVDVDIDSEVFGDYLAPLESDESDEDVAMSGGVGGGGVIDGRKRLRTRTQRSRRPTPKSSRESLRSGNDYDSDPTSGNNNSNKDTAASRTLGGSESLNLRRRALSLLIQVATHPTLTATSPTTFPDIEDLLTLYVEFIKPLSLAEFAFFVLPRRGDTGDTLHAPFLELLLQRTLETAAPAHRSRTALGQQKLEAEYLPFAAATNSVDANARVCLCLEGLARVLVAEGRLAWSPALHRSVAAGLHRRIGRALDRSAQKKGGGRGRGPEDDAMSVLVESGERLRTVVKGLKGTAEVGDENEDEQDESDEADGVRIEDWVSPPRDGAVRV